MTGKLGLDLKFFFFIFINSGSWLLMGVGDACLIVWVSSWTLDSFGFIDGTISNSVHMGNAPMTILPNKPASLLCDWTGGRVAWVGTEKELTACRRP